MVRAPKVRKKDFLWKVNQVLNWLPLERIARKGYQSETGRPSYPPLVMLKVLLIQRWYDLSDPDTEFVIADSMTKRAFCGLRLEDDVPDETTICRFRKRLGDANLYEKIFAEVNKQLTKHGMILNTVTLVDATIVESAGARPGKDDEPSDPQAAYAKKGDELHYGYKAHVAADGEHQLVVDAKITPANINDTLVFEELLPKGVKTVYADKGYTKRARNAWLAANGIESKIMRKATKYEKLTEEDKAFNKDVSKTRSAIEHVFAHWKMWYGYVRMRYRGVQRNQWHVTMLATAYNLKRAVALFRAPESAAIAVIAAIAAI